MKRNVKFFLLIFAAVLAVSGTLVCGELCGDPEPVPAGGSRLPILMYHHVVADGEECNDMTVTASRLETDLQWLSEHGYHTVLPSELAAGTPLPANPVMITFDDGYRSNYELAYPLFQKYQAKAVISLMVSMPDCWAESCLSWDMCREMAASGLVEIGSHTYLCHNLDGRCGAFVPGGTNGVEREPGESDAGFQARVLDDVQKSYDRIAEEVAVPAFFAYPFGRTEPDADPLIQELFPVTAVTSLKPVPADLSGGLYKLPRITVTMDESLSRLLKRAG